MTRISTTSKNKKIPVWRTLFDVTILSAYFYAFMEWLFFVTKPSSLSNLPPVESLKVLFVTGGTVALILIASLSLLSIPALILRKPKLLVVSIIVPTLILTITALLMLDNFTYTIFKFGIIFTEGTWRIVYILGFAVIIWRIFLFIKRIARKRRKSASFLALSLLTVSIAGILTIRLTNPHAGSLVDGFLNSSSNNRPNIIILGSDGLSASYLSMYGYSRDTTPFLSELAKTSLVAKNAFPNATSTTASTTSALTGKGPVTVKVFRYPDILSGKDSFEHLPGILKGQGYKTVEIGTPYYVDAHRLNLLEGFDIVNNQTINLPALDALRRVLGNSPSMYFIQTIAERASERLFHIFFVRVMQNPMAEVYNPNVRMTDEQRVDQIIDLLDHNERPVFIFAHLMDTHGPRFSSQKQVFSSGLDNVEWEINHYQDSILSFDAHVQKIYEHLTRTGQLDNTILVIYTDHGYKYTINERIPILIHFPENAYAGTLTNNVQVIDIPVTVLDYLGIPAPQWMHGTSLLNGEPPADRKIFSTAASSPPKLGPPFHQLRVIQVIACQKWYTLNVKENKFKSGTISGYTRACDKNILLSDEEVRQAILEYLEKNGYNISSLQ